jgi:phosphoglycerate kinase
VNLRGENVLVRVNLNVPLSKDDGVTTDDTRLRAIVPTTKFLLNKGANVIILCSHFGRPKGKIVEMGKNGRLDPVVGPLKKLLGVDVVKADDCVWPEVEAAAFPSGGGGAEGPAF